MTDSSADENTERYYAEMEAARNESEDAYFHVRQHLAPAGKDTFRAGFERAFKLLWRPSEPLGGGWATQYRDGGLCAVFFDDCYDDPEKSASEDNPDGMPLVRVSVVRTPSETKSEQPEGLHSQLVEDTCAEGCLPFVGAEPNNEPLSHQAIFSAVNHFAREILRMTDTVTVECVPHEMKEK